MKILILSLFLMVIAILLANGYSYRGFVQWCEDHNEEGILVYLVTCFALVAGVMWILAY